MDAIIQKQVAPVPPYFDGFELDLEKIYRVEGRIPVELPVVEGARFLFISRDQRALTHGLHKYPAKFFPELPRWLIEKYSQPGEMILDPFMGSATTNIEAMLLGRNSIGIDVDPFARLLAKVKTTSLSKQKLKKAWKSLKPRIENFKEPIGLCDVPEFPYRENWFKSFMLKELGYIKRQILETDTSRNILDFFLVNFSSVIRSVSEADNNCTRTVVRKKLNKQVRKGMAIKMFLSRTEQQIENMCEFVDLKSKGNVIIPTDSDARKMPSVKNNSIDCAITSPPYANAVDYPRTHQLEMYWLGLAEGSLRDIKTQHIGTEVVCAQDYKQLHKVGCESADQTIKKIYDIDPRRAYIASKYIVDMFNNLVEVQKKLKSGGTYTIVVGDNSMRGIKFETWKYLYEKAPELGYKVECCFVSEIINHFIKVPRKERINRDHILVLRK